ncbi:MAG: tetratricopeptide repeat protein [Vicinamibacterales bacterium]|nr:tetratricopeptide repeat protein [Vicinamibacterales bacterium]
MGRLAVVALLVSALAGGPAAAQDATQLVQQGRALINQGKHDEAERLLRQAYQINPRSLEAVLALGVVLDLKGQYAEAHTFLQQAVDVAPRGQQRNQALANLALSYVFQGDIAQALRHLVSVREQQLADGDVTGAAASARTIGRILLETGDAAGGRKWYELGYEEWKPKPDAPESELLLWELRWRHMRARVSAREGRIDEARQLLGEFEALMAKRGRQDEDNAIYRWVAGYVAFYAKDYARAIAELAQGNLNDPFILHMMGMAYDAQGNTANAREYYQRTIESNVHTLNNALVRPKARARLAELR